MLPLLLLACAEPVTVHGTVTDAWGTPVPGATVVLEGVVDRWTAGADGTFTVEADTPPATVIAGAPGYMRGSAPVARGDDAPRRQEVRIALWPDPANPGFFGVGPSGYAHLPARTLTPLRPERPLASGETAFPALTLPAEAVIPPGTTRFVHKSTVRAQEVRAMDLRLSRLTEAPPALRPATATTPWWIRADEVPFEIDGMPGRDAYLLKLAAPLPAGVYAWHAGGTLELRDSDALAVLPRARLLAWPFRVDGPPTSAAADTDAATP
ncbi:MAG: Carboxypeptidase regulatory-like domain [Pseudomonadota bacterium]